MAVKSCSSTVRRHTIVMARCTASLASKVAQLKSCYLFLLLSGLRLSALFRHAEGSLLFLSSHLDQQPLLESDSPGCEIAICSFVQALW